MIVITDRPSKKLDAKYAKYIITEIINSYSYKLNTLLGIYNVFYTRLLKPVKSSPLLGQVIYEPQLLTL